MKKIALMLYVLKSMLCACGFDNKSAKNNEHKIGHLPSEINESSGLINADSVNQYFTHNDSGGEPILYKINTNGKLLGQMRILDAENVDWEDVTKDFSGNYYVGDFGNNDQNRNNLVIYKCNKLRTEKITFSYSDQSDKAGNDKNFDCEAFFWFQNKLYLFTKTWSKSKKICKMYELSDQPGNYQIEPKATYKSNLQVSSAAVSPDQQKFVLLCYGKILVFGIENNQIGFEHPKACIEIKNSQTEGICFENNHTVLFTNEKGKIFRLEI